MLNDPGHSNVVLEHMFVTNQQFDGNQKINGKIDQRHELVRANCMGGTTEQKMVSMWSKSICTCAVVIAISTNAIITKHLWCRSG